MTLGNIFQAVQAMADREARDAGAMTLGELRAALKMLPPETPVVLPDDTSPAQLASYRGYYERLAFSGRRHRDDYETVLNEGGPGFDSDILGHYQPGADDVTIAEPVTVAELLKALDLAEGERFEGYKGGQFLMDSSTFLHWADYGDCGPAVVGIKIDGQRAVIETAEVSA